MKPALPVTFPDAEMAAAITNGLVAVEDGIREAASASHPVLAEASRHLTGTGGKRMRPLLVLLAAQFGNRRNDRVVASAVAVELIHLATLCHDDVMDGAAVRRGVPTANARWGNSLAVWTGDFLVARAARIVADLGQEAIRIQAETFARLVNGQRAELAGPQPGEDPVAHYLGVVAGKTASLFAACGEFGALLSGASDDSTCRIRRACEALGMAYQLSDDLLDITSGAAQSGKTPGTDLRQGVPTLPVLHALNSSDPADVRLLELLTTDALAEPELHAEALSLLRVHPAVEMARADTRRWASTARDEISALHGIPARAAFEALCDSVTERTR